MSQEYVLITGSSKGLGRLLANEFARNGYGVILHGRNKGRLEETMSEVIAYGYGVSYVLGDLKEDKTIKDLVEKASDMDISVLINNAADSRAGISFEEWAYTEIQGNLQTNLIAPILITRGVYDLFLRRGSGSVINMNSVFSLETKGGSIPYSASKWGLRGFSDVLRAEGKQHGIRVMDVYPTKIRLDDGTYGMDGKEVAEKIFKSFQDPKIEGIFLDGRPDEFKPKGPESGIKEGLERVTILKKS
ncbi:MAG: SDR family oxidoreductase [Nanoarchaeota archaeon]|nr:SDR family oxidoreductase [Nanoarchaeota archaeon]